MHRIAPDLAGAAEAIAARGGLLGRPLYLLAETTSTNDEAKHAAKGGAPHGSTWVAESQTAGRGRQGRAWFSPPGENLLFSVLLRLTCPPARLPAISLVAGLAVCDAVRRVASEARVRIKWPNDVVWRGSVQIAPSFEKVAGILVETSMTGSRVDGVVVGVGINVHTRTFPSDLANQATSIARLSPNADLNRAQILADILHELDRDVPLVVARGLGVVHARLMGADALRGARVESELGVGTATGIDLEGRLLVEKDDGTVARWGAGEVHLARADRANAR
jgi:BirA family biotin operon repressor/biotin-[acetyl-CoA-carboxylase] ligase